MKNKGYKCYGALTNQNKHLRGMPKKKIKVNKCLYKTKLEPIEEILEKYPNMLSGGQRQRVSYCQAYLSERLKLIIADEPVSMFHVSIRAQIYHY